MTSPPNTPPNTPPKKKSPDTPTNLPSRRKKTDKNAAPLHSANTEVRRVRFGLRSKFFLAFSIIFTFYALASSIYLLRYFFDDKARYVLFSIHQGAESMCSKLGARVNDPNDLGPQLKKPDALPSLIFDDQSGQIIAENMRENFDKNFPLKEQSAGFWNLIQERSAKGAIDSFTTQHSMGKSSYFLSSCRFPVGPGKYWLIVITDAEQALKPANQLLVQMGGLFLALLITGLSLFYFLSKSLTKPLGELKALADDLGAGNYKVDLNVKGSDELGALADSFSILASRLELRESELEKSTAAANQDFLTGLWNRRYLERRIIELFKLAKRHRQDFGLIYMDADHFKRVNDTYGHSAGDEVLQDLAMLIKEQLRVTDFAARVGGEEFVVVLPETNYKGALIAAQKIRFAIKSHRFLGAKAHSLTASIGVICLAQATDAKDGLDVIDRADKLAYRSKQNGRDQINSPIEVVK